jgi:hypothetical protein
MDNHSMRNTSKMKLSLLCASVSLSHLACKNRNFGEVKLIGGSRAGAENYPALTRIKINGKTHCNAGKVGENLFITAAHCVTQAGFRQGVYYGQKISDAFAPGAVLTLNFLVFAEVGQHVNLAKQGFTKILQFEAFVL